MFDRMTRRTFPVLSLLLVIVTIATPAYGYVGPVIATSIAGSVIGFAVAIFSAFAVLLSWPIRLAARKLSKLRARAVQPEESRPG